ncbi:MAG: ATP-binding protein [Phycisphaerae bacterium]|nr:ATP-binding protein [Phycisphaerae bacterium]
MHRKRFILRSDSDEAREAQASLLEAVEQRGYGPSSCFAIRLALEEALSNAFKHGNRNDPAKVVRIEFIVDDAQVVIDIEDEGEGFDPGSVPDPTEEENLEIPSGRGIVLMKSFMSDVRFEPPGNRVRLVYQREQPRTATGS